MPIKKLLQLKNVTFFCAIFLGQIKTLKPLLFVKRKSRLRAKNEPVALAGIAGNNSLFRRES
jgi:hypothetical protein